jgi:hypothetical protein
MTARGSAQRAASQGDATVIWYEQREFRKVVLYFGVVFLVPPGIVVWALTDVADRPRMWGLVGGFGIITFFELVVLLGFWLVRGDRFVIDAEGWKWFTVDNFGVVRWDELAGAGIRCEGGTAKKPVHAALELFPRSGVQLAPTASLAKVLYDDLPPVPGLPGRRYRIELQRLASLLADVETACRHYAPPDLWHGRVWPAAGTAELPQDAVAVPAAEQERLPAAPRDALPAARQEPVVPAVPEDAVPLGPAAGGPQDVVPPADRHPGR